MNDIVKVNKDTKTYILIALILAGAVLIHGILSFVSKQNELKLEKEKFSREIQFKADQAKDLENNLEACLKTAFEDYKSSWNLNCPNYGREEKENDCSLPSSISLVLEKDYKDDQELCIKKYK